MRGKDELLLLRALLRASDYGVLLSDSSREDLVCNQRFCELFDIEGIEAMQSNPDYVRTHVLPRVKDPQEFVHTLDEIYADPSRICEDEIEVTTPRRRLVRRYTTPVYDVSGDLIGRLWTFLDITRTRRLERKVSAQAEQLRVQARQLAAALKNVSGRLNKVESVLTQTQQHLLESEKLSAVGLLAASVAHDIRNILTPLAIEITLGDADDAEQRAESFATMRQQVSRLSMLTDRLLALARPPEMTPEYVDLGALVHRTADLLRPQASQDGIVVVARAPRKPTVVQGDAVQIDQVLVNLALNALQAMQSTGGGTLTLTAQRDGSGAVVRVVDTGPGIPKSLRRRLFDPFFTTRSDGVGLGLYSCRRIVHDHGGSIKLRSATGRGTQFTVWLPLGESYAR